MTGLTDNNICYNGTSFKDTIKWTVDTGNDMDGSQNKYAELKSQLKQKKNIIVWFYLYESLKNTK